jgi:hypothetical protein
MKPYERALYDRTAASLADQLTDAVFVPARGAGRALAPEEAVRFALA